MLSKERIMVMIRLAMREEEFGPEITYNGPRKREYVGGHMFMFFFVESLLYLVITGSILVAFYLTNNFTFPKEQLLLLAGALLVCYLMLTYLGLFFVRRTALKKYKMIKSARKAYKKDVELLSEILENEQR